MSELASESSTQRAAPTGRQRGSALSTDVASPPSEATRATPEIYSWLEVGRREYGETAVVPVDSVTADS